MSSVSSSLKRRLLYRCLDSRYGPAIFSGWNLATEFQIAARTFSSRRDFRQLRTRRDLKIHLGCGDDIRQGWVNIDLAARDHRRPSTDNPDTVLINHDLRTGLPLRRASCRYIYSSHLIEHVDSTTALKLLKDCWTALDEEGVLRIVLPDFRAIFSAYISDDVGYFEPLNSLEEFKGSDEGRRSIIDYVNYSVYQHGEHRCLYDEQKLASMLLQVGFKHISTSSFQQDVDHPSTLRRHFSLYLEANR